MNLVLTEKRCKSCDIKLTEYEASYKKGYCMDCYKEQEQKAKELVRK